MFLRKIFKLHQIGDARFDYSTNKNFSSLEIIIYSPDRNIFTSYSQELLLTKLAQIIDKPDGLHITEKNHNINLSGAVDDVFLNKIIASTSVNLKNSAKLQIFFLDEYQSSPTNLGLVKDAYNIFLFTKPLENISYFEKTDELAFVSTILHEFAHLLGAGHVSNDGCLLSEKVENLAFGRPAEIKTDFCPEDIAEIKKSTFR